MKRKKRYSTFMVAADHATTSLQDLHSPYSGEKLAEIELAGPRTAQILLDQAKAVFEQRSGRLPKAYERVQILKKAAAKLEAHVEFFAELIATEGGKPIKDAVIEVARAAQTLECCAYEAGFLDGREIPFRASLATTGRLGFTFREAMGPVLAISAFNHPLNLIAHQVGCAIAAGCPVIVKPALETPLSCWHFLELLYECGLPPEMAQPIFCENGLAEQMASSPQLAVLDFIGSARVGWHLRGRVAAGTRVRLEHGGAAPVLIDESADLDQAVAFLLRGGFYHSGQVCVSVQRIYLARARKDDFLKKFVAQAASLRVGDPLLPETECGPLIRQADVDRVDAWVREAAQEGAQILTGGKRLSESLYSPTVLLSPRATSRVMREEIFGPVVCVNGFETMERAIELANSLPFVFQAAVFTQRMESAFQAMRSLRATAVMVNESPTFRADWMPFAGGSVSGLGTGGVPDSVRELTREKLVVFQSEHFRI